MENNKKWNLRNIAAIAVTVAFFAFQMYIALIKQFPPMLQSPLHLIFALTLVYVYFPADYNYRKKIRKAAEAAGTAPDPAVMKKRAWTNWLDLPAFVGIGYMLWYVLTQNERLTDFVIGISDVYIMDYIGMVVTILLLLMAVYRTLGLTLAVFITVFIVYAWVSPYLPGIFYTKPKSSMLKFLNQFTAGMTMTESCLLYTSDAADEL